MRKLGLIQLVNLSLDQLLIETIEQIQVIENLKETMIIETSKDLIGIITLDKTIRKVALTEIIISIKTKINFQKAHLFIELLAKI